MSSPKKSTTPTGGFSQDEKPRLTEEEKKQNHIASGKPHLCVVTYIFRGLC